MTEPACRRQMRLSSRLRRIRDETLEVLQHIEHCFWWLYCHNKSTPTGHFAFVAPDIDALNGAILKYRDAANARTDFVTYKTLVGFEAIFPVHWEQDDPDYQRLEAYRTRSVEVYVAGIKDDNANQWLDIIKRCAATKSNELATFPTFIAFLQKLSAAKPEIAFGYLHAAHVELIDFLPAFLAGLDNSPARNQARALVREWMAEGRHLRQIGRSCRLATDVEPANLRALSLQALASADSVAVIETLVAIVARPELAGGDLVDDAYLLLLRHLTDSKDARWLNDAWFQRSIKALFGTLTAPQAQLIFDNIVYWPKVFWRLEEILGALAVNNYSQVWEFETYLAPISTVTSAHKGSMC